MQKGGEKKPAFKKQTQPRPGKETKMDPIPDSDPEDAKKLRLNNKNCVITGGDSGIGKAVALAFGAEGANVAIIFLPEDIQDAKLTQEEFKKIAKGTITLYPVDISKEKNCKSLCEKILKKMPKIDVLVNNAGIHFPAKDITEISTENLIKTFETNVYAMFWMIKYFSEAFPNGASIINTTSVTAYRGSGGLLDYSATKGAVVSFTRSLSANLMDRKIRVNAVAPGPVWTPLIPASFKAMEVAEFGTDSPMKRAGQPSELAPAYVYLASEDSSFMSGQVLHVNGGEIVNG